MSAPRLISQSATKIEQFFQCNTKYFATFLLKAVPYTETAEQAIGKQQHALIEQIIKSKQLPEPSEIMPRELIDFMARILRADGEITTEFKFGIGDMHNVIQCVPLKNNWDKQPDNKVFLLTGAQDIRVANGIYTTIVDLKSGRPYKDKEELEKYIGKETPSPLMRAIKLKTLQLDIYAFAEFLLRPQCQLIKGVYYFSQDDTVREEFYSRENDFERLFEMILGGIDFINESVLQWQQSPLPSAESVPQTVGKLCDWCGYKSKCPRFKEENQTLPLTLVG